MDIPFKPIRLEDKEIITSFTFPSDYRNCDFSFANMCSWRFLYDSEFAIVDGYLLIRFMIEDKSRFAYMMPVGDGDLAGAVRLLEEDSLKYGHPLCMLGITPDAKEQLEGALPGSFFYIPERDYFDYIYRPYGVRNTNPNVIISIISRNNIRTSMSLSRRISSPNA